MRALLRLHRVLLRAAPLQPHHQLDHRARAAAAQARALRAGLPPAGVGPGPPGHEQRLLLPDPPGRVAGPLRVRADDHGADQQRLQHPADPHRHGAGPILRRVLPAEIHVPLHHRVTTHYFNTSNIRYKKGSNLIFKLCLYP